MGKTATILLVVGGAVLLVLAMSKNSPLKLGSSTPKSGAAGIISAIGGALPGVSTIIDSIRGDDEDEDEDEDED